MRGRRLGSLIGAVGGLLFVLINAGALPGSVALAVRVVGALAFLFVLWRAVLGPRGGAGPQAPPAAAAWRTYWTAMLIAGLSVPAGASLLNGLLGLPQLTVLWVVFVVGAHFLPFAGAFAAPIFRPLAWTLIGLAAAGVILALTVWPTAPGVTAVLAGFVLLGFSLTGTAGGPSQRPLP